MNNEEHYEKVINRITEIINSLCEEFTGLTAYIRSCDDKQKSLEITFVYIPLMSEMYNPHIFNRTNGVFTIHPYDVVDFNAFEYFFRKCVIKEVINNKGNVEFIL